LNAKYLDSALRRPARRAHCARRGKDSKIFKRKKVFPWPIAGTVERRLDGPTRLTNGESDPMNHPGTDQRASGKIG